MTQSARKKDRQKIVSANASSFVENFSKQCHDTGVTDSLKVVKKECRYYDNYDQIKWDSTNGKNTI